MNMTELCQFLESNIDPENLDLTLDDIDAAEVISESLKGGPCIGFVIESLDLTVVKVLKAARKCFGEGEIPVLLSVCDDCDIVDSDSADTVEIRYPEVAPEIVNNFLEKDYVERLENKTKTTEVTREVPTEDQWPPEELDSEPQGAEEDVKAEPLLPKMDIEKDAFKHFVEKFTKKTEELNTLEVTPKLEGAPLLLTDPVVIEDDENTEKTYE